jgi:hypothetical protein
MVEVDPNLDKYDILLKKLDFIHPGSACQGFLHLEVGFNNQTLHSELSTENSKILQLSSEEDGSHILNFTNVNR